MTKFFNEKTLNDDRFKQLSSELDSSKIKLWSEGDTLVGKLEFSKRRENQLQLMNAMKRLYIGFDTFESRIKKNNKKSIVIISNDASKRMYRNLEKRMFQNPDRFFVIYMNIDALELGKAILKKESAIKFVFIEGEDVFERFILGFS